MVRGGGECAVLSFSRISDVAGDHAIDCDWISRNETAVLTAYFDATYNHYNAKDPKPIVHTLACYVGTDETWGKFRREWERKLARKSLAYFHMTDFEYARSQVIAGSDRLSSKSPYRGWSVEQLDSFLSGLHKVINLKKKNGNYRLRAFAADIIQSDYDETIPDELKNDVQCCSHYIFNVVQIIKAIRFWADGKNYNGAIHYSFSAGDREDGNIERLFLDMWTDPNTRRILRLGTDNTPKPYSIRKMKEEPALQAADIAAYEMNKGVLEWINRGYVDIPKTELRKALTSLAKTTHAGLAYRKEELKESFDEIVQHNRDYRPTLPPPKKKFSL